VDEYGEEGLDYGTDGRRTGQLSCFMVVRRQEWFIRVGGNGGKLHALESGEVFIPLLFLSIFV
jgi:hypothetical protein